jgi:ribosome-associated protein
VSITPRARELTVAAAEAAADKLAEDIVAFDVSEQLVITDAFLICSAPNDRQVKSIVDAVEERLRGMGAKPARREGEREGRWVLLDYVDIIVHVQHAEERLFYSLERIWKDCPTVELPDEVRRGRSIHDAGSRRDSADGSRRGNADVAGSSVRGAAS